MICLDGIVYSLQKYGGVSVYCNALAEVLDTRHVPFSLLLAGENVLGRPSQNVRERWQTGSSRLLERYRDVRTDDALMHSSYYRLPSRHTTRSVITVYDFTYERYFPWRQRLVHSWQKFRAIRRADVVLCISESTRRDLLTYLPDVDPRKTRVTHLAANPVFFDSTGPTELPLQDKGAQEAGYVLFVGARSTYKNFLPLVHALEGSHLHLVCVGGGAMTPLEQSECQQRMAGRYHHIGWVDDAALKQLYMMATGLVFPSFYEGFGIPVVEAMASGCPVVASNVSSIPEVAGDAGILLDRLDADSIRAAISDVQDPIRRADLIAKGREQASRFTWQQCVDHTLAAYSDLHVSW